jgi:hypothetical protein
MSIPMLGSHDGPAMTGSIGRAVEVEQPLPPSLAYSDAMKIGQAADAAFSSAGSGGAQAPGEWVNAATGSSGSVERSGFSAGECRGFSTVVTSIGGVHRYVGELCRPGPGRPIVRIQGA